MQFDFSNITPGNKVDFLIEGDSYYCFYLELIDKAEICIHL
jgi:hypothetical protein